MSDFVRSWRTASTAAGWAFPAEWLLAEVIDVAESAVRGEDPAPALFCLGAARARAGAQLTEAVADLTAFHRVVHPEEGEPDPDAVPSRWLRSLSMGWADAVAEHIGATRVDDGLTGLTTGAYLRTRLTEVYQACEADGTAPAEHYGLVVVTVEVPDDLWLERAAAMVLVADTLHGVFSAGQTRTLVTPATAVVLTRLDPLLPSRVLAARRLVRHRLHQDGTDSAVVRMWLETLPSDYQSACGLLESLRH
ncbi:hypothetical protein GCM10012275_16510 [Longimycelium tulufanense]|uniref:Uncharacterized protein n=1 Tax=Longimycelium tulufanense TaxID=907463 RepID=A0A8J3CAV3_9PSEU|nr:hypothetical protein [Longimycelium tulufanense]GGM46196.1 hypothetical protein GCM10012275_16510 [Longimycelium tulufanense]